MKTLDDLVDDSGQYGPFIIKIDVQGYELPALRGGSKTISKTDAIISEFWPFGIRLAGYDPRQYLDHITKNGFKIQWLDGRPFASELLDRICRIGAYDTYVMVDLLFTRK